MESTPSKVWIFVVGIDEAEHSYAALGDGGNAIYVNPKNKIVVSISSLFVPRVKDRIDFIKKEIEPLFI